MTIEKSTPAANVPLSTQRRYLHPGVLRARDQEVPHRQAYPGQRADYAAYQTYERRFEEEYLHYVV